ncbi:MAG: Ig-like domain-containing protein [Methanotrichaceae archaeon]|nr:Ig-like domain-containing protein [Methanotrichaceae archaeon]
MKAIGAVKANRKAPKIALLMIVFLLSASASVATCGCKEQVNGLNEPKGTDILFTQQPSNDESNSGKAFTINETPMIPHMKLRIIRPENGEVFVADKSSCVINKLHNANSAAEINLLAVTDIECTNNNCADREIRNVQFFEGINFLGNAIEKHSNINGISLWEYFWKCVDPGTYTLTASAINCKNQTETSSPVTITVKPKNNAPKAVITNPYDGQIFSYNDPIPITIHTWDSDNNVTKVEIYENSNKLYDNKTICNMSNNCSYNFTWIGATPRVYSLRAVAVDMEGAIGTSSPITIIVNQKQEASGKCTFTSPPRKATLISPYGTIGTVKPTYSWNSVPESTNYHLIVYDASGNVLDRLYNVGDSVLRCTDSICSVTPPDTLSPGNNYNWLIQTINCYAKGPWSSNMSFRVTDLPPGIANPIAPNGLVSTNTPIFTWTSVPESTKYRLKVDNQANQTIIDEIYKAEDVTIGYNCSTLSPRSISNNGIFFWEVQAINDFGETWSGEIYFETICAIPKKSVKSPAESANQLNEYIKTLPNGAFKVNADRRKSIILENLEEVAKDINARKYPKAINRLANVIRTRADGSVSGDRDNDWIIDHEAQRTICKMIDNLIADLNKLQGTD